MRTISDTSARHSRDVKTFRVSAAANVRWVGISQFGRAGIQLASVLVFSHLLPPADFGVFALATVVTNLATLFRDMGTSAAVIQRAFLTDTLLDTVFWLNAACGLAVALFVAAAAPAIAWGFGAPPLRDVLRLVSGVFIIGAIAAPHLALLERENRFRRIAWIEISSAVFGFVCAVAAAWAGGGVYSLVVQTLLTTLCSSLQLWIHSDWKPTWRWSRSEFRDLWGFSGNLVTFNLINYAARNGDAMLIGRFLGPISLGWYSMASRILMVPLQNITFVMGRALLPIYSRKQDDPEQIASYYLRTMALIAALCAPLMFGIWALRTPLIEVALGPRWLAVADVLAWFAPMGFFQSLNSTTGTVLAARGRTDLLRTLGIVNTLVILGAYVVGLHFGLLGVARAYFLATIIVTIGSLTIVSRELGSRLRVLAQRISVPVMCGTVMAAAVASLDALASPYFSALARLAICIPVGSFVYSALIFVFSPALTRELRAALSR